jgi:serine/threonine protein kinase
MHANSVIHRDIKCGNILVNESGGVGNIKIADLGESCILSNTSLATAKQIVGTPLYLAPELIKHDSYDH